MALEVDDLCVYDVYMYELVDCITSKLTAHVYHELKCIINKGLVHFLIRKLTFGLLSDNAAMHLLQDDSKFGPLALLLRPSSLPPSITIQCGGEPALKIVLLGATVEVDSNMCHGGVHLGVKVGVILRRSSFPLHWMSSQ